MPPDPCEYGARSRARRLLVLQPVVLRHGRARPARRTLEIGCGEGRVARDLARRGHTVVALDTSPTLLRSAKAADPAGCYLLADAASLPFHDASFDLVVAYNSLMDVSDMPAVIA
jgi:ubiquinone/menaquinone biosynthesis C-methylase UbiE